MPKGLPQNLGTWMAQVERKLDNLSSGNRLDHASLDGTTLYLKGDGELGRIGRQPDGSMGVHVAKVQPPPQLTAPILTVGEQAGTCLVEWDGGTFDGRRMPLIHGHTEIWAELVGEDWSPTVAPGDTAKRVGTIRDRTGGEVVVALPQAGTWAVWLRAMGADRETAGPWSPVSQVEISPLVDTDAIEAELEDARDRLTQAEQDLAAGMADRVAEIEYLRETRIPELQDNLTDLTETRLPAVESTLSETRLGMENLRDVRLPDLQDTLNSGLQDANEWREVGAISAENLRVGSFDNLFLNPTFKGFEYTRPEAAGTADGQWWFAIDDASGRWETRALNGTPALSYNVYSSGPGIQSDRRAEYFADGVGIPYQPGEKFHIRLEMWPAGYPAGHQVNIRFRETRMGSQYRSVPIVAVSSSSRHWVEGMVEAPSQPGVMSVDFQARVGYTGGFANFMAPHIRRATDGAMIVDGSISARHIMAESIAGAVGEFLQISAEQIDTEHLAAALATILTLDAGQITTGLLDSARINVEEFFAAQAVIDKVWTDIVRSRLIQSEGIITEDMIATGAITTPKLTVTEEMVGEVARLLRIEAGSLASNDIEAMRIVSSLIEATTYLIHNADGDVSVRLDGMDNYIAGRLHAGMTEQAGISLDYHQAEVPDDWADEDDEDSEGGTSQFVTPEAEFHSSHTHELQPKIFVNADGALTIDPGKFAGQTRRLLQVFRGVRTQRVESVRYQVQTNNANYPGGLMRDGDRMRIYGRAPDWSHPWGTFTVGQLGPYNPSTGNYRGSIGFSAPAETGTRIPTTSGRMSQGSVEAWRSCTATVGGVTASGFFFSLVSESTSTNMWVIYNAIWQ